MRVLRRGMNGPDVERWQYFLRGQDFDIIADGDFGPLTEKTTIDYQKEHNLFADGIVGHKTFATAMLLGFSVLEDYDSAKEGPNWPHSPDFHPLSLAERKKLFGDFKYVAAPSRGNPEGIRIIDDWARHNIVQVKIPQLAHVQYSPPSHKISWHTKGADQIVKLFKDWEDAGLLPKVLTWAGSWNPRFVRGSRVNLSNHSWSTAFDINAPWNGLGKEPARVGKRGCVRELVEIANENGFYWGGHFSRKDGMHFELAKLL